MDIEIAKKAMEATVKLLGEMNIPMVLFDQIGIPIKHAINNMLIGLDALREPEVKEDGNVDAE